MVPTCYEHRHNLTILLGIALSKVIFITSMRNYSFSEEFLVITTSNVSRRSLSRVKPERFYLTSMNITIFFVIQFKRVYVLLLKCTIFKGPNHLQLSLVSGPPGFGVRTYEPISKIVSGSALIARRLWYEVCKRVLCC